MQPCQFCTCNFLSSLPTPSLWAKANTLSIRDENEEVFPVRFSMSKHVFPYYFIVCTAEGLSIYGTTAPPNNEIYSETVNALFHVPSPPHSTTSGDFFFFEGNEDSKYSYSSGVWNMITLGSLAWVRIVLLALVQPGQLRVVLYQIKREKTPQKFTSSSCSTGSSLS